MAVEDEPQGGVDSKAPEESAQSKAADTAAPIIFGASAIGPLHIEKGVPCQDAYAFSVLPTGLGVIAIADGLGSASMSDVGATVAVQAAVESMKGLFADSDISPGSLEEMVRSAVVCARKALELKSVENQWGLSSLACTIVVIAFREACLAVGHIGDGAVVGQTQDGLRLLSGPGESEYANEVVPLTSNAWMESLRILPAVSGIQSVAALTDGCQRAALRRLEDKIEPFEGFFAPIFAYARELPVCGEAGEEIKALLSSKKICENSEDDKTLVVAVLS